MDNKEVKPNYGKKLILRHFTGVGKADFEDVALFIESKTRRGIICYRALILEDCFLVAGERMSLFPHRGVSPAIKKRLEELKLQTAEILAKRQILERASFKTLEMVARKLAMVEEREANILRRELNLPPLPEKPKVESAGEDAHYTEDDDEPVEPEEPQEFEGDDDGD